MNWETAKTWLITVFFVLDLLLGLQLWQSKQEMQGYVESYSDLLANTRTLLAEHGLVLNTTVPTNQPDIQTLHADFANVALPQLAKVAFPHAKAIHVDKGLGVATSSLGTLHELGDGSWQVMYTLPMPMPSTNESVANLPMIWHANQYMQDDALSNRGTKTLVQRFNGLPIFDTEVQLQTTGSAVTGYTQSALTNLTLVGSAKPIISALDALNSLANSVDKTASTTDNRILKIDLGYARKVSVTSLGEPSYTNYWFPVWRVVTSQEVFYINALSGEVDIGTA